MRPRVGHIQFLNCLPLYYGLVKSDALLDMDLIKGTPTELNSLLISGKLDVSPISSIEYARNYNSLVLFPSFTVSSDGEVKSILLLSRVPIEELSGRKVALTSTSATSHVLLKLILQRGYGVKPQYHISAPDLSGMLQSADAALLIGDTALEYHLSPKDFYVYDLGMEWKRLTGRKMVYAVWAARREFAMDQQKVATVFRMFMKSMEYSRANLEEIAAHGARWEIFSKKFLMDYFESLRFDFTEDYQEGLLHFYRCASQIGELADVPDIQFIPLEKDKVNS